MSVFLSHRIRAHWLGTIPPPSDIVKVAIECPDANLRLLEIDQKRPLASIIKEVCDGWSLPNPEYYILHYTDGPQLYIAEQSRATCQLMERTQSSNMETWLDAMKDMAKVSADVTFITEFINMNVIVLMRLVESRTKLLSHYSEMLAFTLTAFLELMDRDIVSWDMVSITLIKQAGNASLARLPSQLDKGTQKSLNGLPGFCTNFSLAPFCNMGTSS
ncbi:engulfment and cell motility protein 2-like [Piliocolobus tephrosceles]|uniref:engulfment and cell motility protein 2-like n=1 Tax=Piliocolobus tephrosceles TaxID=591936 RepID=UPI000E6B4255|nr:engulfment and cell motility protein 2-like [Piliocolobus tephrosceles]